MYFKHWRNVPKAKTEKVIKMDNFANYKDGTVTINTHRFPDAQVTDVADIINAVETESEEILVASIDTDEELASIEAISEGKK